MQHIAVIRPEIAASSVATGKVNSAPQQQEGFSRHLNQHSERQGAELDTRQKAQRRHGDDISASADNAQSKQTSSHKRTDASDESAMDKAERIKSGDATSGRSTPGADTGKAHRNGTEQDSTAHRAKSDTDKHDSAVTDDSRDDKDIDGGENNKAEEWLALVHKLVTNAGMAGKGTESSNTENSTDGESDTHNTGELSEKLKALLEQLGLGQETTAMAGEKPVEGELDAQKALLEKLGLDAEKVLQQAQMSGKLSELKALLQGALDGSESQQGKPMLEQVLALLLVEQKGQADTGEPIAQNHALGLKTDAAGSANNSPGQSDLVAARWQEYQQRMEKSGQQDKNNSALLKSRAEEMRPGATSEAVASANNGENAKQQSLPKNGSKESSMLQNLARLPEPALDKTLQNLAERLPVKDADPAVINSFIDNLKAGIEEFKQQRAQGREPGLDLQGLVSRAMGGENDVQSAQQQNITQVLKQFGESLTQSSGNLRSDIHHAFIQPSMERVSGQETQIAAETTKAAPHSAMERAVNIARPEAAGQLADRVRMLVNQGNMSADIRLDPPDLGSMQIRISMNGEQASVNFVVQSQQARDMLDQAVPRLRDMLAERGIELGQSSVEQQQKDNKSGDSQHQGKLADTNAEDDMSEQQSDLSEGQEVRLTNGALGGIDYFV